MTEATLTSEQMKRLKKEFPLGMHVKRADRSTKGLPDLDVTHNGFTTQCEIKFLRKGETLREAVQPIQEHMLRRFAVASHGRAWILVFDDTGYNRRTCVLAPTHIDVFDAEGYSTIMPITNYTVKRTLEDYRMVATLGFDHALFVRLVELTHTPGWSLQ